MKNRLVEIHEAYETIIHSGSPDEKRDQALARLMTAMEQEFHIPAIQSEDWEKENKPVIALYRILSESRTTL